MRESIPRIAKFDRIKNAWQPSFWVIFSIAIYIPFEEFLLKWIPGPDIIPNSLRFVPEITLYFLCMRMLLRHVLGYKLLKKTPIDLTIGAFLVWAIFLIYINKASIFAGANNLRTLLRYLSVYYIIVNLQISREKVSVVFKTIIIVGLVQGCLAFVQYFAGSNFNNIFVVKEELKAGAVNGTFANTAVMVSFLLITSIAIFTKVYSESNRIAPTFKFSIGMAIVYFGIFTSIKRMGLLIALMVPFLVLHHLKRRRELIKAMFLSICLFFLILLTANLLGGIHISYISGHEIRSQDRLTYSYFLQIFTPEYLQASSENSRLWSIKVICNGILNTGHWFGLSPDLETATETLANLTANPIDKNAIEMRIDILEDVYWFAMLMCYGIPGITLFILILHRLYRASEWSIQYSSISEYKQLGVTFSSLLIIVVVYGFAVRILEFRPLSFYFWLLAGMVMNVRINWKEYPDLPETSAARTRSFLFF